MRFDSERGELEFGRFRINVFGEEEDIRADEFVEGGKRRGFCSATGRCIVRARLRT